MAVYYKVAGAAEPASYSWTFNTGNGQAGGIMSFIGVDTTDPVDIDLGQNTPVGFSHAAPSVTTTTSNVMLVTSHSFASAEAFTPPPGMTEAVDVSSVAPNNAVGQSLEMNYLLQPVIGPSGVRTATVANVAGDDDAGNGHTLALRPATPAYFGFGMTDGTTSKSLSASSRNYGDTTNTASRVANKAITIVKWDTATTGITRSPKRISRPGTAPTSCSTGRRTTRTRTSCTISRSAAPTSRQKSSVGPPGRGPATGRSPASASGRTW
jgi:hypothetical protein